MGIANPIKTNFTSGEISPLMQGRIDVTRYHNGASRLENFVPLVQGGITRKPGTLHVEATKDSSKYSVLIPFVASSGEAYIIEFGDQYLRLHKDALGHRVLIDRKVETITGGSGSVIRLKIYNHRLQTNDKIIILGTTGVTGLNNTSVTPPGTARWLVTRINDDEITLQGSTGVGAGSGWNGDGEFYLNQGNELVNGVTGAAGLPLECISHTNPHNLDQTVTYNMEFRHVHGLTPDLTDGIYRVQKVTPFTNKVKLIDTSYTSAAGWALADPGIMAFGIGEIATPYLEAELDQISYAQSADVLFLFHPNHSPLELRRYSDSSWHLADYENYDGPYLPKRYDQCQLTAVSNQVQILASATSTFTDPTSVGKYIEWKHDNIWRCGVINAVLATDAVIVDVVENILAGFDPEIRLKIKRKASSDQGSATVPASTPTYTQTEVRSTGMTKQRRGFWGRISPTNGRDSRSQIPNSPEEQIVSPTNSLKQNSGTISSTHKDVFKRSHIGKYVKIDGNSAAFPVATLTSELWWHIETYTNDSTVGGTQLTTFHGISGSSLPLRQIPGTHKIYIALETENDVFKSSDVGRWITFGFGETRIFGKVYLYLTSKTIRVQLDTATPIPRDPLDSNRTYNDGYPDWWRLGAWSTDSGWPALVTFHEQRLVAGRTKSEPQTLWFSKPDDFTNHEPTDVDSTVLETSAMTYTISSTQIETLRWLNPGPVLMIGTDSAEWQARAATSTQEPISPSNISITRQRAYGSKEDAQSVKIGNAIVYVQKNGRKLRELAYNFEIDAHASRDISVISEHLPRRNNSSIKNIAYQQEPHQMVWVVNKDGQISAMTYDKDQDVIAWCRMKPGGSFNGGDPVVESIAVIPGTVQDMVYMIVKRTINSVTARHIEVVDIDYFPEGSIGLSDQYFVDNGRKFSFASPVSTLGGLAHLTGETLQVLADGTYIGEKTATGGVVLLGGSYSKISIGYKLESVVEILPLESGGLAGVATGKIKRFHKIVARLWKALRFKHGVDESDLISEVVGTSSFFSDDHPFNLQQRPDRKAQFLIKVDEPVAFTLLALMPEGKTNERP